MYHEQTATYASRKQRVASEILRDSATMRLLGVMPGPYWPQSARTRRTRRKNVEPLTLVRRISAEALQGDAAYYRTRSEEERDAAAVAGSQAARKSHDDLADLYTLLANAIMHRSAKSHSSVEHREALLDDALDDTFPASDPLSITLPQRARLH